MVVIARYEDRPKKNGGRLRRLRVVGDLSGLLEDLKSLKTPDTFPADDRGIKEISYRADSEEKAEELARKLDELFEEKKEELGREVELDYRGPVAVPPNGLGRVEGYVGTCRLASESLMREAKGDLEPGDLEVLDYDAFLEKL